MFEESEVAMEDQAADKTTHPQDGGSGVDEPKAAPVEGADEETGASPGTAQACNDLGLNSLAANLERFGIKPPGQK